MTRPVRILVPNFPAPDSFTDNVVHTLRAMGHDVRCMDRLSARDRGRVRRIAVDTFTGFFPQTWSAQERWAVSSTRNWTPDLVLALTIALREEVLSELRSAGTRICAAWWGDTPANMRGMGLLADGWDKLYIKDAAAVSKFRAVGLSADVLHEAANPDWHKPTLVTGHRDSDALVVAGNYYGYRQFLVRRLAEAGVPLALYGNRPPRWSNATVKAQFRGSYIVKQEKSEVFHSALACLNCTHLSEGQSLNCRAFETCGAGGLQLIEHKDALADCYEPGREVLTYASVEEIVGHLDRARAEPGWAMAIREAGYRRTVAEHTYRHRLTRILSDVGFAPLAA